MDRLQGIEVIENERLLRLVTDADIALVNREAIEIGFAADRVGRQFLLVNERGMLALRNLAK